LEISEISRGLKAIAKELHVPVLALSQLSRAIETRSDKEPQLSDLRDSGSIEQDADVVLMLHRDDSAGDPSLEQISKLSVFIKKHRNGPTGKVELTFDKAQQRMYSIETKYGEG
jgi:replicative DNA helicase